jgi:hypothetical protein
VSDSNKRVPTQEEIELRAYELYLKRGGESASALDDWLAAEKELTESLEANSHEVKTRDVTPLRKRGAAS